MIDPRIKLLNRIGRFAKLIDLQSPTEIMKVEACLAMLAIFEIDKPGDLKKAAEEMLAFVTKWTKDYREEAKE